MCQGVSQRFVGVGESHIVKNPVGGWRAGRVWAYGCVDGW